MFYLKCKENNKMAAHGICFADIPALWKLCQLKHLLTLALLMPPI